jgi:hypothetical protein
MNLARMGKPEITEKKLLYPDFFYVGLCQGITAQQQRGDNNRY